MAMKELSCRDVGLDCDARFQGQDEEEVMRQAEEHGRTAHGMTNMDDSMKQKVRGLIHEVQAA
jgi:predicted small metal-binding protein